MADEDTATAVASMTKTEKRQVEELSEGSGGPPLRQVPRESDHPVGCYSTAHLSASIPVVDLRRLFQPDGSSRDEEMANLRSALGSWGLFQATGHGIPTSFLEEVRRVGKQFLELPMEEKQRYSNKGEGFSEGYGHDRLDTAAHNADCNDRLMLYVEPEDQRKLEFWPDNPVSLRETVHKYSAMAKMVVQQILREMARSLELEETHFIQQFGEKMTTMCRFSHYPSCLRPGLVFGCKPHSDNTVLTVILPGGEVEGLEVLKGDMWVRVPYNPDVLLVLMGDLAEIMSNGLFKSPLHRVVSHQEKERTSTCLFYAADPEREIGPAEKLIQDGMPRLYRDFRVQDYIDAHLRSYSQGKSSIDWAKAS